MKVFIKHVTVTYMDATTFEDEEGPDLIPIFVEVHYEFHTGTRQMSGKTDIDFSLYKKMRHIHLVDYVKEEIQSMFT